MEDNNVVIISGMVGSGNTYFADNPVVIEISGLEFPQSSPIRMCRVNVLDNAPNGKVIGEFPGEVGSSNKISFDINSAIRALWAEEDFAAEVAKAQAAIGNSSGSSSSDSSDEEYERMAKPYWLNIFTEYIDSQDGGLTTTQCHIQKGGQDIYDIPGGHSVIGGRTEWERYNVSSPDVSLVEHTNLRNGDASTKPTSTPELVGKDSITSWVDILDTATGSETKPATKSIFYPAPSATTLPAVTGEEDDPANSGTRQDQKEPYTGHSPIVLRDDVPYVDFIFVNRRGAVETCSGQMLESLEIPVETRQTTRVEAPTYKPSRTIMATATGGRRSWSMSSGYQTREWAEWWTLEFLMARRHWMRYKLPSITGGAGGGSVFVPVTITPAKKTTSIYDRTKQEMMHVDFTVTLALEG